MVCVKAHSNSKTFTFELRLMSPFVCPSSWAFDVFLGDK